jgi:hypothetical protein
MKVQYVTALILIATTLVIAFISTAGSSGSGFIFDFGSTTCGIALLWVLTGILLTVANKDESRAKNIGYGFLMSAGLTMLIGAGVCSTLLMQKA